MSVPLRTETPGPFGARRLLRLVLLGIAMTPIAAIVGAALMPGTFAIWIFGLGTLLVTQQWNASGAMFAAPLIYGAEWALPITCIVLPCIAALLRSSSRSAWLIILIGVAAAAGAASGFVMVALVHPVELTDPAGVLVADIVAGAVVGTFYGFAVRRWGGVPQLHQAS